jgi:DNA (cytosine-5)-methyltransferase 1
MSGLIVAAFAGPGGMCTGARLAGHSGPMVGIDHDMAACRTAVAAGHLRIRADIATYPLEHLAGKVDGLTLTPPCPTFSSAGQGAGRHLIALLCVAMTRTMRGENVVAWTRREAAKILRPVAMENRKLRKATRAQRSAWVRRMAVMSVLAVEPARWVRDLRPRWVALEQVPAVLPVWRHFASLLREHGYQAWAGKLDAECYGVPQTRDRAILIARNDGLPAGPPLPTHQAYLLGREPDAAAGLFGDPLPPPMSMADAIGWGLTDRPAWTVTGGGTDNGGVEVFGNAKSRARLREVVRMAPAGVSSTMVQPRPVTSPAHTLTGKATAAWVDGKVSIQVTAREVGVLQSFPPDYPWQGTVSQQHRQAGDAVPPLLAAAILRPLIEPASAITQGAA